MRDATFHGHAVTVKLQNQNRPFERQMVSVDFADGKTAWVFRDELVYPAGALIFTCAVHLYPAEWMAARDQAERMSRRYSKLEGAA